MDHVAIAIVGAALGVLTANSRVPRIRWAPMTCSVLLEIAAVLVLVVSRPTPAPLLDGFLFCVSVAVASTLYAGLLWKRMGLDPAIGLWGWVWRDAVSPRYLRESARAFLDGDDPEAEVTHGQAP
ncbi:hypothetical protein [Lacisediminihabitans sp.]|uniref:hypothetical protein n=1 Tax=Lacisediminihabitans sp. TaxID=2787631 RepID=UPI002ED818FB